MPSPLPLWLEPLEPRDVPATFGTPWPDGQHLTLSFAPDGTPISGSPSDLAATLNLLDPIAQLTTLRAFQTWATYANMNIGLVSDSGAAFGTGAAVQGDPRFGDIRVGGRPLAPDVLAITAPYNLYDTFAGNVVLNTAANFGTGGTDLYTVLLQEAGHALGIGNSPDASSAMFEFYQHARSGLSAGDIAAIRALYGARAADTYEGAVGNDTVGTAALYPKNARTITADLTTATDVDVYKLSSGLFTNQLTVTLRAKGLSLVTARVELLDSSGRVLASGAATDSLHNDIALSLGSVRGGQTYYVRVAGARTDEFAIGSYELDVKQSSLLSTVTDIAAALLEETGLNDSLLGATSLLTDSTSVGPQTEYSVSASFGSARDVDAYRVKVPSSLSGAPVSMLVTVWGSNGGVLNSWVEVIDSRGRVLDTEVIRADGNTTTLQVRGLEPGAKYFVRTFSDTQSVGAYHLVADLRADDASVPELVSGTLTAGAATTASFTLIQSGQVHLVLTATGSAEAVVTDAAGREVGRFTTSADRGRSLDLFLPAGTYTVTVRVVSGEQLSFRLGMAVVTDPVGARPEDPTPAPVPTVPPPPPPSEPLPTPPPSEPAEPPSTEPSPTPQPTQPPPEPQPTEPPTELDPTP